MRFKYQLSLISTDADHLVCRYSILKAGNEGYVNTFIVCPSAVVGKGSGPVKTFNPYLIRAYTSMGKGVYVGEGSNILNLVSHYRLVWQHLTYIYPSHHIEPRQRPRRSILYCLQESICVRGQISLRKLVYALLPSGGQAHGMEGRCRHLC